jgi:hypothetical protein
LEGAPPGWIPTQSVHQTGYRRAYDPGIFGSASG